MAQTFQRAVLLRAASTVSHSLGSSARELWLEHLQFAPIDNIKGFIEWQTQNPDSLEDYSNN